MPNEVSYMADSTSHGMLKILSAPCLNLVNGYDSSEEMMSEVFDPSVNEIVRKVLKQIRMSRNPEKSMNIKVSDEPIVTTY